MAPPPTSFQKTLLPGGEKTKCTLGFFFLSLQLQRLKLQLRTGQILRRHLTLEDEEVARADDAHVRDNVDATVRHGVLGWVVDHLQYAHARDRCAESTFAPS